MARKSANLYARIEPEVKEQAESILATLGIPASNAINMIYEVVTTRQADADLRDLGNYIYTITDKSPKKFRFTLVSKLQNLSIDVIENLYRANSVYLS